MKPNAKLISEEDTYAPCGERYVFSVTQLVEDVGAVGVHIATLTQDAFACPGCSEHAGILRFTFDGVARIVQRLMCQCYRTGEVAATRRLQARDATDYAFRWHNGAVEVSGPTALSGIVWENVGSTVECWPCVMAADAHDWQDDEGECYGPVALPPVWPEDAPGEWFLHCRDCRQSWTRATPADDWRLVSFELDDHEF